MYVRNALLSACERGLVPIRAWSCLGVKRLRVGAYAVGQPWQWSTSWHHFAVPIP